MRVGLLWTLTECYESLLEYVAECDEIWHADDIGAVEVFDRLRAFVDKIDGVSISTKGRSAKSKAHGPPSSGCSAWPGIPNSDSHS
jgi:hypothetical protein